MPVFPLDLPPFNEDGSLRYYTDDEKAEMDIRRVGVKGEGDHIEEEFSPGTSCGGPRLFSCKWEYRYNAMLQFLGYAKRYVVDGEVRISRLNPMLHHSFQKFNWLATSVRIRPWRFTGEIDDVDFGETLPQFTRALLEVHVERVPFTVLDDAELPPEFPELDRYVTYPGYAPGGEVTSETNYIQSPGAILNYTTPDGTTAPAGVPIPYNIGITESLLRKRATWRRVPADIWGPDKPLTQMIFGDGTPGSRGYIGSLNKVTLFGHPPLTLKLEAVEEKQMADATGLGEVVDITYVWSYKPTPYGHLGYYYYGTSDPTNINGYYQVLARTEGQQTLAVADIDDDSSAFHVRDHRNLFLPGGA